MSDQLLFSVAGARGIVGKTIDVDVVTRLTLAFCNVLPSGHIVVGRDTRPSGEAFKLAAMAAVSASGRKVIDVGIAATPTVELMVEQLGAAGGIILTASHNPIAWNALKFLDHRGIFINKEMGDGVLANYQNNNFDLALGDGYGAIETFDNASQDHIADILALDIIDVDKIRERKFKVVLDCINGAGSVIAPDLLAALGVEVVGINVKDDGDFFRDPEPRPDTLQELAEKVKAEGADLGFASDPDADRLALVDNTGTAISEEYTLAVAIDHVLSHTPGPVVANMSTSGVVDAVAKNHAVPVYRTPVGEAHVVARMLESGAPIGGEGNGGVIYPTLHPGRDAPLGMAFILQILAERGVSLRELVDTYPPFVIAKSKTPLGGEFSLERISGYLGELNPDTIDTQDGVKAVFADRWIHLRISNTEGVVRIITEAPTAAEADELQQQAKQVLDRSWN